MSLHLVSATPAERVWELDLRDSPRAQHPSLIFECLEVLGPSDQLVVDFGCAPEHVRRLVETWCPHEFAWTAVTDGPPLWQCQIMCRTP